jgi:hypothetical protein
MIQSKYGKLKAHVIQNIIYKHILLVKDNRIRLNSRIGVHEEGTNIVNDGEPIKLN